MGEYNSVPMSEIIVEGLFDTFRHKIELNQDSKVTIIYGPNGFGKTTVLRMVDALMCGNYTSLRSIQFTAFMIEFSTGDFIHVLRTKSGSPMPDETIDEVETEIQWKVEVRYKYAQEASVYYPSAHHTFNNSENVLSIISHRLPWLRRIGDQRWRSNPSGEILSIEDIADRYRDQLPVELMVQSDEPDALRFLRNANEVRFVKTQRLEATDSSQPQLNDRHFSLVPMVEKYATELRDEIQKTLGEYGKRSQLLDRTFPNRVIRQLQGSVSEQLETLSGQQLSCQLGEQEKRVTRYQQVGLLDRQSTATNYFSSSEDYENTTERVLSVYVKDNEQKLSVLEPLAKKIELLKEIINQHFAYKQIEVSGESGFYFSSTRRSGEKIRPSDLSSGEQHLLILAYELLFNTSKDMLIIIDEPEISLHVVWQEEFLKNLEKIVKLSPFHVLIATHSPQIIADRWDLAYGLTGPDDLQKKSEENNAN